MKCHDMTLRLRRAHTVRSPSVPYYWVHWQSTAGAGHILKARLRETWAQQTNPWWRTIRMTAVPWEEFPVSAILCEAIDMCVPFFCFETIYCWRLYRTCQADSMVCSFFVDARTKIWSLTVSSDMLSTRSPLKLRRDSFQSPAWESWKTACHF